MLATAGAITGAIAGCLDDGADEGRTGSETNRSDDDDADRSGNDGSDRSERRAETATVRSRFEGGPVLRLSRLEPSATTYASDTDATDRRYRRSVSPSSSRSSTTNSF